MTDHSFPIATERRQLGSTVYHTVSLGPLCVNWSAPRGAPGWYVSHLATGCVVGEPWTTLPHAIAAAGALLALPIDWASATPTTERAAAALVLSTLARVREVL